MKGGEAAQLRTAVVETGTERRRRGRRPDSRAAGAFEGNHNGQGGDKLADGCGGWTLRPCGERGRRRGSNISVQN
jgi:hypothetical protein